ncbi:MAG: 50S ribosomal protein L9 [Bifidobacteriaceae bacterium]|jgi:large subunit ribosomal protein L9|nr:50S ribosomal protein L9 [Bifidobacteriaceae bacterium]
MTKIILQKSLEKLGSAGDIINVKDGYARNFLIPSGFAIKWTKGGEKHALLVAKNRLDKEVGDAQSAESLAKLIAENPVVIEVKTTKTGKLYGSITAKKIAEAISKSVSTKIDSKSVKLAESIKEGGDYTVEVILHPEITAEAKIKIVATNAQAK